MGVTRVPTLNLGQVAELNASRTATLFGDLNDLLITLETSVTHLLCFTKFLKFK